jgi:CubicO group peptidase (beta-lactamase class C family)
MTPRVRKMPWIAGVLALLAASGCSTRSGNPARIATGYISHVVCSYVFVSGLDPARVNEEHIAANPVFSGFNWALSHEVDLARREVKARAVGGFESRAVYRDGLGCVNLNGTQPPDAPTRAEIEADGPVPALLPDIAGPEMVAPTQAALKAALDGAFAEPDGRPVRRTHAVVIVHDGRVVAERYAEGFGIDTPVHGWSATKSVNNALLGILVRQGKLNMEEPAPSRPGRPRRSAPRDHAGSPAAHAERPRPGRLTHGDLFDRLGHVRRMAFSEPDMAGFAESAALKAAPGTKWTYANGNPAILARIVRDRVGGHAVDVLRFARRELFGPLGIGRATLELDSTGTPIAGAFLFATPRQWARFGCCSRTASWADSASCPGMGALLDNADAERLRGIRRRMVDQPGDSRAPASAGITECPDAFMALGICGQTVVVVPSERLVITRFGTTYDLRMAMIDICRLTADTIAAVHTPGAEAPRPTQPR